MVAWQDAGLVTALSSQDRDNFIDLVAAVVKGDGPLAAELMVSVVMFALFFYSIEVVLTK
jgi:predicted unusual protein kinase regulating ubiquinone biosynthesis (AarF/ABC1/UbiB family)